MRNFLEPVDVQGLGLTDYNDVIERPMDLQTLRKNVKVEICIKTLEILGAT